MTLRVASSRVIPTAALAVAVAVLVACGGSADARTDAAEDTSPVLVGPENIFVVREDTVRSGPTISGALAAEREASIRAEVPGPVLQTFVDQGQQVRAGQVLARVDDTALRDQFLSARSGMTAADAANTVARREAERAEALVKEGAIAEREAEAARSAARSAEARLADARARLVLAQEQLAKTQIRAPFTGIVSRRDVSAGDVVAPGTPLFTVVDPSSMRLEAAVPAAALGSIRLGAPVSFTVTGYPGRTFTGRITRISPVADPTTGQVPILISIPNLEGRLVAGLFAEGRIATTARIAPIVPVTAVDRSGATTSVVRLSNGRAEVVAVALGIEDPATETVEITAGVAPGDTVLLGTARGITGGTPVRVSAPADRATASQ